MQIRNILPLFFVMLIVASCEQKDNTNPVIVLSNPDYGVRLGGTYVEPGALATDKEDGVIDTSALIIYNQDIRTDSVGEFDISYFVTDMAGNEDSTKRNFAVYASRLDYQGTWNVAETCADTQFQSYTVDINALGDDTTLINLINLRNRGVFFELQMNITGRLGRAIDLTDTLVDLSYKGSTILAVGTQDSMRFELNFTEKDTLSTLNCEASFTKP
ncbi:MAG: hypothetical protein ACI959_000556 [Limisphaerales bacterium]|jgi:hypothetical protein